MRHGTAAYPSLMTRLFPQRLSGMLCRAVLGLVAATGSVVVLANAQIVYLAGQGERKDAEAGAWQRAAVNQSVPPGGFVRTLSQSQMGLLLPDRTQIRLNQNSQLQIKSATDAAEWTQTTVRLNSGRAWSQARPATSPAVARPSANPRLTMETPSATLSIRGTDWEVEVDPAGTTQLVVLSGQVTMGNAEGELLVAPGEAALAQPGKAPVKFRLANPAARVQWVSAWRVQPARWSGPVVSAADRLLADGEIAQAIAMLQPAAAEGRGDPAATALLARSLVRDDRLAEGRTLLAVALDGNARNLELLLAAGELAILDGDAVAARRYYRQALAAYPDTAEAWYGLGRIDSERENVSAARVALGRALGIDAELGVALAERGALETFANELHAADRDLRQLLDREPDNYVALTALGINHLKSGRPGEALVAFLKAGTIEPRYARAWMYSGAAFYRLGEAERALEALRRAGELDPRDPLPHLMTSLVIADRLDFGEAIVSAGRAQERMPFLKSLNQVANDQKGSANLGSALAAFGMEEWATRHAHDAYSPFWAGSHLFLADRHTGLFAKNSALYQGFITDPTVFGASNRQSTLISGPGHYGRVDLFAERAEWRQNALIGTVNGVTAAPSPIAYFLSGDLSATQSRNDSSDGDGRNLTLGLGIRPRHDLGLFGFATTSAIGAVLRSPTLSDDGLRQRDHRIDLGANIKLAAENQLWFKLGSGRQTTHVDGRFVSASTAATLNGALSTTIFSANGSLDGYDSQTRQGDIQFRQAYGNDRLRLDWGVESARLERPGELVMTFNPARLRFAQDQNGRATEAYVAGRWHATRQFDLDAGLWYQSGRIDRRDLSTLDLTTTPGVDFTLLDVARPQRWSEFNVRLGANWRFEGGQSLKGGVQRWRHPGAAGGLAPLSTAGIAINDPLVLPGGQYRRQRIEYDVEAGGRRYLLAFLDRERIDNGVSGIRSSVPDLQLTQLESLRNRRDVFTAAADLEDTPQFASGQVNTAGLAANALLGRRQTLALRYLWRDAGQGAANSGRRIPWIPRHTLRLSGHWSLPQRWLAGVTTTHRGQRFRDDANLEPVRGGWSHGFTLYWESADKRISAQGVLDNLLSHKQAGKDEAASLTVRLGYRF